MPENLRSALTWYVRADLQNADAVEHALDELLKQKHDSGYAGNFDLVESHNEQWLSLEAMINEKYGIDGIKKKDLSRIKKKSGMKQVFNDLGLPVARGARIANIRQAIEIADYVYVLELGRNRHEGPREEFSDSRKALWL